MQRQKTIAKWLAVLLLATLAVACYIAFSAIFGDKRDAADIAGANSAEPPSQNEDLPADDEQQKVEPVYSKFPREATVIGGREVAHFGGEGDDRLLDSINCFDRTAFVFETSSTQFDARGKGIYLAVFDGSTALLTSKVGDEGEEYVDCTLSAGGLLVVTKSATATILRLVDRNFEITKTCAAPRFADCKLFTSRGALKMYATTEDKLKAYTISRNLDLAESSSALSLSSATVAEVIPAGENDLLFVQRSNSVLTVTFSSKEGFILRNEMLNMRFKQLLPTVTDGKQTAVLLTVNDDGLLLTGFTQRGETFAEYAIDGQYSGALFADGTNVLLYDEQNVLSFCSHLERTGERPISFDGAISGSPISYIATDGINGAMFISAGGELYLAERQDDKLTVLFSFPADGNALLFEGEDGFNVAFDADCERDFAHESFGAREIYYVIDIKQNR